MPFLPDSFRLLGRITPRNFARITPTAWLTSPHLASILAVFIFALNYVVGRGVRDDVPPFTLGFFRWAGADVNNFLTGDSLGVHCYHQAQD